MTDSNPAATEVASLDAPRATRRDWIGLAVLALPCLLYSMDLTVLNLAVPQLTADLKPSAAQLLWIVDIYGFLLAGFLVTMGTLGDRIGRRRLLLIGASAFGIASVFAAFSTSAGMLIAARALLGIAAATLAPSTLSLIRNMFLDPRQRTFAIGVWIASFSAGGAIGPLVGGVLLEYFWWGSVFLLAVPMMLLLLALGPVLLPEFRDPQPGRLDIVSALLSISTVLSVIYGCKRIAEDGVVWQALVAIAAGLAIGAVFVHRQRRLADPMIDLRLFRTPALSAALGTNIVALFVAFGFFLLIAQYLQLVLGMGPFEAGLWTAPTGVAFVAGSMLSPVLVRRIHPARVIAGGFALSAVGFGVLTQLGGGHAGDEHALWILMTGFLLFCLGISPIGTLTTDLVVGLAPPERAGAASAISETSFEFGGALGIAVIGSIAAAVYRRAMATGLPADLSPQTADSAPDTLGGALAVARDLPEAAGLPLMEAARAAFTQSLVVAAAFACVLALIAAGAALVLLRRVPVASSD
jgi:DHA2 family multidrug resistance protein-like MFS transporter